MRPTVPLVLGMLVGLAAGYLAGSHDSRSVARPIRVAESEVATSNESGTAPPTELAAPPSPPRRPLPSALTFDLKDWLTRSTAHPAIVGVGFQPTLSIWDTLAFVYVRTGAVAELESVLVAALASAVPVTLVEAQLSLVAPKEGLACLRRLRQAFPDLDWNEAAYARMLLFADDDAEGARVGLASIDPARLDVDMLNRLAGAIHRSSGERGIDAVLEAFEKLKALGAPTVALAGFAQGAEAAIGTDAAKSLREEVDRRAAADTSARAANERRNVEDTRRAAIEATVVDPRSFDAWRRLGEIELDAENRSAAYQAFRRANEIAPNELEPIERMIEIDPHEAVGLLERRVREIPDDDALRLLTLTLLKLDRGREAAEAFFRVSHPESDEYADAGLETLAPDAAVRRLKPYVSTRGDDRPRLLRMLARAYETLGRHADALATLESSKDGEPDGDYLRELVSLAPDVAREATAERVEREPQDVDAHLLHARALRRSGRLDEARIALAAARRLETEWHELAIEGALLDPEKGFAHLVERAKTDTGAHRWLGEAYMLAGRWPEARAAFDRHLAENDPDEVAVLVLRNLCR